MFKIPVVLIEGEPLTGCKLSVRKRRSASSVFMYLSFSKGRWYDTKADYTLFEDRIAIRSVWDNGTTKQMIIYPTPKDLRRIRKILLPRTREYLHRKAKEINY